MLKKSTYIGISFGVLLTCCNYDIITIMINPFNKSDNARVNGEKMKNADDKKISKIDLNKKTVIYILLNAIDEVSPFFQNFYSLKESEEEAINDVMKFTSFLGYQDVIIEEIKVINIDDLDEIEELIEDEGFDGFIQNIKEAYPSVE
jgi:hypothetical protein